MMCRCPSSNSGKFLLIPVDDGFKENVRKEELRDEALSPVKKLSQIFLDQPEGVNINVLERVLLVLINSYEMV